MLTNSRCFARERNISAPERREKQLSGFYTALVEFYTEDILRGFLPCGFPEKNIYVLVFCSCCYFSDPNSENCFKISSKKFKKTYHVDNSLMVFFMHWLSG